VVVEIEEAREFTPETVAMGSMGEVHLQQSAVDVIIFDSEVQQAQ
jgi:hypothetical protein